MSAVATKLQENGECFEANPFMTLKTAALMNSNRAVAKRTVSRSSRAAQLSGNVTMPDGLRSQRAKNDTNDEAEDFVDSSASTRHGGEDEFEADDDYEEQIMCAFLLEQVQKEKRPSHGSSSKLVREEDGESMTLTTETASLSSRDSSSRYHNSTNSISNTRRNNKSLHSLDALIGDTGETMRLASMSRASRNQKRSSGSRRSGAAEEDEDEDIISEAISQERRRSSHSTTVASRNSMRSERTNHSSTKPPSIGSHSRRRSDDNSKSERSTRRSYTADDARRAVNMDASNNMESSSSGRRSSRGRRSDNHASTGQIVADMAASAPTTPSRRSRIRDRSHSNGKASLGSAGDGDSAGDVEGSVTPNNSTSKRLQDRPNSMELRRVVRDRSRRGRRATIGHDILMRNLQLQGLDDQQDESGDEDDDDSCAFEADFGDDFSGEGSTRMGGSERHYSTSSGSKKTDVWKNRRMAKPVANTPTPQRVSRANRQGSIQAATAALLAQPADGQEEKAAVPGFGRSHTTSGIAQRRSRLRGSGL